VSDRATAASSALGCGGAADIPETPDLRTLISNYDAPNGELDATRAAAVLADAPPMPQLADEGNENSGTRIPARRLLDAMIDLPFALPTAVAGIALAALYAPNGWIGAPLAKLGIKLAFTPAGIVIALIFIGIPFVVRTVQPVLQDLDRDVEEAAVTLGAPRIRIVFSVLLPLVLPALLTGFALAFARSIGEYGSVIFIAGNMPMFSEIAPLLIVIKLEEFDYQGAAVIGVTMLGLSFVLLLAINLLQRWSRSWQQ